MENASYFLVCDIGASSGRLIIISFLDYKIKQEEIYRFPNIMTKFRGHYYWDIYALFKSIKEGLKVAATKNIVFDSIGIDTWGVDFLFLGKDGTILGQPIAYRDPYTNDIPKEFYEKISKKDLYRKTGIQIMNFNSVFQLYALNRKQASAFSASDKMLFIPDALSYMLCGKAVCEYTIASTSQMLNSQTKRIDCEILDIIGIDETKIPDLIMPGTVIGKLDKDIADESGLSQIPVIAVAGHDTASAVIAVPSYDQHFAYLNSGTWSLMGIEVDKPIINEASYTLNFTNEGGVNGRIRFLKNITGMWLLECCRKEWEADGYIYTYEEIIKISENSQDFEFLIDPDDDLFANPVKMIPAIKKYCENTGQNLPASDGQVANCIFNSLALKYRYVFDLLRQMAPFPVNSLYVIGGGARNKYLNQKIANAIGMDIYAGPTEATSIGNAMMQAQGLGIITELQEMRDIIRKSIKLDVYTPQDQDLWNNIYRIYKEKILKL